MTRDDSLDSVKVEPVWARAICGGLASMTGELFTLPVDTVKVRLQLQKDRSVGAIQCFRNTAKEEGVAALWKGLSPALLRQAVYSSARMAVYEPIRNVLGDSSSLWNKLAAGGMGGCFGAFIANPTDLIKVRMQADVSGQLYTSLRHAFVSIVRSEGICGKYIRTSLDGCCAEAFCSTQGVFPNLQRAFVINAAELATYDHTKHVIMSKGWMQDGVLLHGVASFAAGLAGAITSTPIDTMKTRLMQQPCGPDGHGVKYSGMIDCARKTIAQDGISGMYRGFFPTWFRIGPWAMIMFMSYEEYRKVAKTFY